MNRIGFLYEEIDRLERKKLQDLPFTVLYYELESAIKVMKAQIMEVEDVPQTPEAGILSTDGLIPVTAEYTFNRSNGKTISCYGKAMNPNNTYCVVCSDEVDDGYWDTYVDMMHVDEEIFDTGNNTQNWYNICRHLEIYWSGDIEQIESDE